MITLELIGASQNKLINLIDVGGNKSKLLKTIEHCYKKAPFFDKVFPIIRSVLEADEKNLSRFVGNSIRTISYSFNLDTRIIYSSDILKDNGLSGQDSIIEIAKILGATEYINAIGGQALYDKREFSNKGIQLQFLRSLPLEYKQFGVSFTPNLSIIDTMMFNGLEETKRFLSLYELK